MELKVYARAGHRVLYRGRAAGQLVRLIGRETKIIPVAERTNALATHRALKEPTVLDSESVDGKEVVRRMLIDGAVDPPLWAADAQTAQALGVKHVELVYNEKDGEWYPKQATKVASDPAANAASEPTKKGNK